MTARTQAQNLLRDLDIQEIPVSMTKICRSCGIRLMYASRFVINSCYMTDPYNGEVLIIVNEDLPLVQQRFNVAHELGHIVLKHHHRVWLEPGKIWYMRSPIFEEEADAFASELLMPDSLLNSMCRLTPEGLADLCDVSIKKARARLNKGNSEIPYQLREFYRSHRGKKMHIAQRRDREYCLLCNVPDGWRRIA